jgi:hypothetical protein
MEETMTDLRLPAPEGADDDHSTDNSNSHQSGPQYQYTRRPRERKGDGIPDEDACLRALAQVPGLEALGYITNRQANTMTRVYSTILQHLDRKLRSPHDSQGITNANLVDAVRQHPEMLNSLEHLFTDEQIDEILKQVKEDRGGQA